MSPFGKLTLALIGLRLFGAEGFFVGMFLGHFLIDRTHLIVSLERRLSIIDDNIRLLLPYKYYRFYNRLDGHFWGKIWGAIIGGTLWGFDGLILLFIVGHFVFDTPDSHHARRWRKKFDHFWDNHWGTIGGAILGFVCRSRIILFCGVIIGFLGDYYRMENASLMPVEAVRHFWKRINPLKLWRHSKEARHVSFIQAMAGLAAKVAKADGQVSENEVRTFKKLFAVKEEETSRVAKVFNEAKKSSKGYEKYAVQLADICADNIELQENILDNLFKIAVADGEIKCEAYDLLAKIAGLIGLPDGNYEMIKGLYTPKVKNPIIQDYYDELGVLYSASDAEIKARWKKLIVQYHPDRQQAKGASAKEIEAATAKMAKINFAYQEIVKMRSGR